MYINYAYSKTNLNGGIVEKEDKITLPFSSIYSGHDLVAGDVGGREEKGHVNK